MSDRESPEPKTIQNVSRTQGIEPGSQITDLTKVTG
jgi:hypothetical protein